MGLGVCHSVGSLGTCFVLVPLMAAPGGSRHTQWPCDPAPGGDGRVERCCILG